MRIWLGLLAFIVTASLSHSAFANPVWTENGASCVPVGTTGVNVSAGAVTAGSGTTVILYCPVVRSDVNGSSVTTLGIIYKGNVAANVNTTAEFVEMSRTTGVETIKGTVVSTGSSTIVAQLANVSAGINFNNNFYYVRVTLKSGTIVGQLQTIYGVSLCTSFVC